MLMKKLILAVIIGLTVAGGMKEAGAAACCCSRSVGEGATEGNKTAVAGETDCVVAGEMADHEGTKDPRDPGVPENSEAKGGPSGSLQQGPANEAASPIVQEDSR
jgi:hypothetical protein